MDLLQSIGNYFSGTEDAGSDASAPSAGSGGDAGSAFGSFFDTAANLSDDAAQFAQNVRTVYDAAQGTTKVVSGAPVAYQTGANVSSGVNTPGILAHFTAWIQKNPLLAGAGGVLVAIGLFFGIRALIKK
jgi:hypothetical protein